MCFTKGEVLKENFILNKSKHCYIHKLLVLCVLLSLNLINESLKSQEDYFKAELRSFWAKNIESSSANGYMTLYPSRQILYGNFFFFISSLKEFNLNLKENYNSIIHTHIYIKLFWLSLFKCSIFAVHWKWNTI